MLGQHAIDFVPARDTAMAQDEQSAGLTPTILVVEDDDSLRHSLRFWLAVEGFAVRTYAKGSELLGADDLPDRGCLVVDALIVVKPGG